jgi:hypothetical protein
MQLTVGRPMKRTTITFAPLFAVISASFLCSGVLGQIVAEHQGSNVPDDGEQTTRWVREAAPSGVIEGPAGDEKTPAWRIEQFQEGGPMAYDFVPSEEQHQAAEERGWKLSVKLRVDEEGIGPNFCVCAYYAAPEQDIQYTLSFGATAKGEPIVALNTDAADADQKFVVTGGTRSEFHLYELIYDPVVKLAKLVIDGKEFAEGIRPDSNPNKVSRIGWGSRHTHATGAGEYNLVRFEILD